MNVNLFVAFVAATVVLIVIPGPTVLLITSTSLRRGTRAGLIAVAGSSCAVAVQLTVVVGGVASVLAIIGSSFEWIRWAGVGYLVYLGLRTWFDQGQAQISEPQSSPAAARMHDFLRGFLVTLTNPKTLLFLGAFLPQFVDPATPELPQLAVLAASFLAIAATLDSIWAVLGANLGRMLAARSAARFINLLSGSILIAAGAALAFVRRTD